MTADKDIYPQTIRIYPSLRSFLTEPSICWELEDVAQVLPVNVRRVESSWLDGTRHFIVMMSGLMYVIEYPDRESAKTMLETLADYIETALGNG